MCPKSERKALPFTQPLGSEKLSEENLTLNSLTWGNLSKRTQLWDTDSWEIMFYFGV